VLDKEDYGGVVGRTSISQHHCHLACEREADMGHMNIHA